MIRGQLRPTLQYKQSSTSGSWHLAMIVQALILERNPLQRRLLIEFLRRQPGLALVAIAATLEEALALCRSRCPNLVVASLSPAIRQGLETIRTLKENLLWVRTFETVEDLRQTLLEFKCVYNESWILARHGYKTPVQVRAERLNSLSMAA